MSVVIPAHTLGKQKHYGNIRNIIELSETLLNIFRNFNPQKVKKFDYETPEWINKSIRLSLKKRTKLTKKYHMNPTVTNKRP